jgi:hypothetical protein
VAGLRWPPFLHGHSEASRRCSANEPALEYLVTSEKLAWPTRAAHVMSLLLVCVRGHGTVPGFCKHPVPMLRKCSPGRSLLHLF